MHTRIATALALVCLAGILGAEDYVVFRAPGESPREQLTAYLNAIGRKELTARAAGIAKLKTRAEAERRQQAVREKLLRLIGGLPDYHGPLNTRQAGVIEHEDYRIEKVIYESLPGFYVTANVYVPKGTPPFPAVLMPLGHYDEGKVGERPLAIGLARKGFVALEYDPIGQGERLQYYDPDLRGSKVGGSTDEHSHANAQTLLIGDSVARYRVWDGVRGIDYLVSRKDVDAQRIGCTGCSGGGTLTTYISALDRRVKVAVPACYINSWMELLEKLGPQDGEQAWPRFLSEGLDIADYIELFAPKPWMIASTIQDFFPLEGARQAYEESRHFYALFGAQDRIAWYIGPGGHGVPLPSREAIYGWFLKWLKNGEGDPRETPAKLDPPAALLCTKTGQVSDSLGGETVFTLNRKRAADVLGHASGEALARDVRELAAISIEPGGAPPPLKVHRSVAGDGYRIDVVSYEPESGIRIPGLLLAPQAAGVKPAVLMVDTRPKQPGGDPEDLAKAGYVVLAIQPRGAPETGQAPRREVLGDYGDAARAYVVGKTLVGMRAEDIIRAVDYLASRPDVDHARIAAFAQGAAGVPLLDAAVLDRRISRVVLERALASYRTAVEHPVTRGLYDVLVPGVLRKYDLGDLVQALAPRPVVLLNPVDALGKTLLPEEGRKLRAQHRAPGEPLRDYLR